MIYVIFLIVLIILIITIIIKNFNPNSSNRNYCNNNEKPIKTLNIKDISCNDNFNSNDNENIEINNTNNSVDFNNHRITRSIAKIIKENLEQVICITR